YVKLNPDGTVALNTGAAEIGTAALTGAAQVLAEDLGVDLADISVVSADTFATPFDFGAQGSRTAFAVGNACRAAAADLRRQLCALAAAQWGVAAETLTVRDKHVVGDGKRIALVELARLSQASGGGLIAHGTFIAPPTAYDAKRVEAPVSDRQQDAHDPRPAAGRVDPRRAPEPGRAVRREGRRRAAEHRAPGGRRERGGGGRRRPRDDAADHRREGRARALRRSDAVT